AYCQAFEHWRTALEALKAVADRDPVTGGLIVRGAGGGAQQSPLLLVARKAAGDMVRYAAEFGFTPAARARIAAGPFADPGGPGGGARRRPRRTGRKIGRPPGQKKSPAMRRGEGMLRENHRRHAAPRARTPCPCPRSSSPTTSSTPSWPPPGRSTSACATHF